MKKSTMQHRTWIRALLFASLALNLGVAVALALRSAPTPPPPTLDLPEHLALTSEQRTQWAALETPFTPSSIACAIVLMESAISAIVFFKPSAALLPICFALSTDRSFTLTVTSLLISALTVLL